jgi:cytochrome o ubiquinol oxidase subunit 2
MRMDGWSDLSVRARGLVRRIAPIALSPLAGCSEVMDPAGPIGSGEKLILLDSLAIMLCIVVPVIATMLAFAWWFRSSNTRAVYRPDFAYSGRVEVVVWAIPLLVIMFLGGITWIASHDLDPAKPIESAAQAGVPAVAPIDVQVVSLDWKWLFIYPAQGVATVNHLVIPAGVPVHFHITSASVMNAFFVPRLGSMIYSMNGMSTQLFLKSDRPGRYMGLSSHYSGDGFSDMHFVVDAVPAAQFAGWAAAAKGKGGALDPAGYAQLSKQSQNVTPYSYGAVMPGLYDAIVTQKLPPAPGPPEGDPQRTNKSV